MKLSRTLFLALGLALTIGPAACSKTKPEGTSPPDDGDGKQAKRGKDRKNKGDDGGGEEGGAEGG
ncbi:MAG TPA: hypothetical protein VFG69_07140, partial [Nannocystaceae bacterium]|nr:hypothetical protein [Nannocystaceae bacterium]